MTATLPGFDSPAVGFEQPFEMLAACHERVRRSLALLERLLAHVENHGHDDRTRSAAVDVLRYFDLAAPLHHQDEERHVFPALADSSDAELAAAVAGLRRDHLGMESLWAELRQTLLAWSQPGVQGGAGAALRAQASAFAAIYASHLRTEEEIVFPAARSRISEAELCSMSADMAQRRGGATPVPALR
jgi:hemerythrin-like domain-containing protein